MFYFRTRRKINKMESIIVNNKALSVEDIIKLYPNQWVLLGNPILRNPQSNGSILNRLISGVVLSAHKNKRELARLDPKRQVKLYFTRGKLVNFHHRRIGI